MGYNGGQLICSLQRGHFALDVSTPGEVYCNLPHPFAQAA